HGNKLSVLGSLVRSPIRQINVAGIPSAFQQHSDAIREWGLIPRGDVDVGGDCRGNNFSLQKLRMKCTLQKLEHIGTVRMLFSNVCTHGAQLAPGIDYCSEGMKRPVSFNHLLREPN